MNLSLFDLHCDTAFEMLRTKQPLTKNDLAVSLEHAKVFDRYVQVMAFWTDYAIDDEAGWQNCLAMLKNLRSDPAILNRQACIASAVSPSPCPTLLLGIEDARILANDISRVDRLFEEGFRILTPLWKGNTCIGGSHDTNEGLTPFGKAALDRAVGLGMILDISHASEPSADDMFEISARHSRPVIASHSDTYSICPVSRNLRDAQIRSILCADGVIGLNLYRYFLREDGNAGMEDVFRHVDYLLEMGAEQALCLGCDMDGCDLPPEIPNLSALGTLAERMLRHGYSESLISNLFYENAASFASKYIR